MSLNDFSTITVSANAPALSQVGFGTLLILAYHTKYSDRTRVYERASYTTQLATEGFGTNDAAYKAIAQAFAQNPSVQSLKLGRADTPSVVTYRIGSAQVLNATEYAISLERAGHVSTEVAVTTGGSATGTDIPAGLKTAIDLLVGTGAAFEGVVAATGGAGTAAYVDVTAPTGVGLWLSDWRSDRLTVQERTANPDIAADIATIQLVDDDWYALGLADTNSVAAATAAAGVIETPRKIFGTNTSDSIAYDASSTADQQSALAAVSRTRTISLFDLDSTGGYSGIAAVANLLPFDPGEGPFAGGVLNGRTLGGVTADALTPTQKANLQTKGYTINITTAGVNHALGGQAASGEWIDFVRFADWFVTRLQEDLASLQLNNRRIPYDARGLSMVESVLRARLAAGLASGGIVPGSESIELPDLAAVSSTDRGNRILNGCKVAFQYSGAIQKVGVLVTITE